ncbi:helix-turn-helix domain-containing protein, partial [Pseudomonas edaphica]
MDTSIITQRLGQQVRSMRLNRGYTQADLAKLAGVTRQKLIEIEKGSLSVSMNAYARVIAALG